MEKQPRMPDDADARAADPSSSSSPLPTVRRILHCDMDCFYAAVHMRDDRSLVGRPVVIGGDPRGRGVVAAASYEARVFGIRSAMPAAQAVRLCRDLVFIRPDFKRYRQESERIFAIYREFTPVIQTVALDEAYLDLTERLEPWGSATAAAREIRRRVQAECGLTVSIGVGPNRLVAKIASDADKPDGLTVVKPGRVLDFLAPLPVRRLLGVGPATERRLGELGVKTIAELRSQPRETLVGRFGRHGEGLYRASRGIDERPVRTVRERKSLGHERTYRQDLRSLEDMDGELGRLAAMVTEGLEQREMAAGTVTVKVRYGDFTTLTRSLTLPAPSRETGLFAEVARELLRRTEAGRRPVRLLGVTASGLVQGEPLQLFLFEPSLAESSTTERRKGL